MTLQATTFDDPDADQSAAARIPMGLTALPDHPSTRRDSGTTVADVLDAAVDLSISSDVDLRVVAIENLVQLLEANRRLQSTLAANAALCEASLRKMMNGSAPAAVLVNVDVAGSRLDLAEMLGEFERARHRSRSTFIAAQFESGMNMKEIGRSWAISRQLAHRFFREARRD
jgi:hypothetical protein